MSCSVCLGASNCPVCEEPTWKFQVGDKVKPIGFNREFEEIGQKWWTVNSIPDFYFKCYESLEELDYDEWELYQGHRSRN